MRSKFKVDYIIEYDTTYEYKLSPIFNWTPGDFQAGRLELTNLKSKGRLFEVGKKYMIDITEARMGSVDPTEKRGL